MEDGLKVLVITNMYPSKTNKSFGSFVKVHTEAFKKYTDVKQFIVANREQRTDLLRLIHKYGNLMFKTLFFSISKKFDVIHAHYAFPTGFIGLISKWITRKPLIITVHGGDINILAKRNEIVFRLCKLSLDKADALIAVSEDIKRKLTEHFDVDENKIHVTNMGVDTEIFKPLDKAECREKIGFNKDKKMILFVGNLIPRKGVVYLIEAINLIKSYGIDKIECILLGSKVDKKYVNSLYEKSRSSKIDDIIRFIDPVPYDEVALWMNAADIFVLPSQEEPFGLVALEALACGTPTIATAVGGLKELVVDEKTGYSVPPQDPKAIANKMMRILNSKNKKEISAIRKNGLNLARSFSTPNQIKKIEKIYNDLAT